MKRMLARKDKELPAQQRQPTDAAFLAGLDDRVPTVEGRDVRPNRRRRRGRVVHLLLQRVDVARVGLERVTDLLFEVVDDDEVREEGDQVLDAEAGAGVGFGALEEVEGRLDAGGLGDDFFGDGEPEFFAEGAGRVWAGGDVRGEVDLVVLEGQLDGLQVLAHGAVDVHAGLHALGLDAEAEGEVGVVELGLLEGLRFEVGEEGGFVGGGVRGVDGYEGVVDGCVGGVELVDDEEEVADRLVLNGVSGKKGAGS